MHTYIIRTHDPEGSTQVEVLHEKEFTEEEFDEMSAECIALAIKKDCDEINFSFEEDTKETISLDSYVHSCANIMIEKYGFIKPQEITQIFEVYWLIERDSPTPNGELIYKHIDKLLNK